MKKQMSNRSSRRRLGSRQRGSALVEYIVVALALVAAWTFVDNYLDGVKEHNDEYADAMAKPH